MREGGSGRETEIERDLGRELERELYEKGLKTDRLRSYEVRG